MNVSPCRTYHSNTVAHTLIEMPDGKSAFKVYYISIVGRDDPTKYEWGRCPVTRPAFETLVRRSGWQGVGFITAFPHITKLFRFAPSMETVLHVRAFNTADLSPLSLEREDGGVEFACYAEAAIAADEYHAWACVTTVATYRRYRSPFIDGKIKSHRKLAEYWAS